MDEATLPRPRTAVNPGGVDAARAGSYALRMARPHVVGVISDTHGLVRPEALAALRDVDAIVHAGDVGGPEVLDALRTLAPVTAVRGNNDRGAWADALSATAAVDVGDVCLWVLHDAHDLDLDPRAAGFAAVIAGHSHRPGCETRDGVLFLNPGSAGPRRFRLPVAVARLTVRGGDVHGRIVLLDIEAPKAAAGR
jgi:putative phosphoesterase